MVKQNLWSLKSHKYTILEIFIKPSGSGFDLLLCMKPHSLHNCVVFQGVLSRALVLCSRRAEGEGKAFREDEQLIYGNDCPAVLWLVDPYSFC